MPCPSRDIHLEATSFFPQDSHPGYESYQVPAEIEVSESPK